MYLSEARGKSLTIRFFYGRRESLTGKSQAYKKAIRAYLESLGYYQTTDSQVEGTFEDMIFYNPLIAPKKRFVIEAKAEKVALHSKRFARELVSYFRIWQVQDPSERFKFLLFARGVTKPSDWEASFSESPDVSAAKRWCGWFNEKCRNYGEPELEAADIEDIVRFLAESEVNVADELSLETALSEKQITSAASISRIAKTLLDIVDKRKSPVMRKSKLLTNLVPINVPEQYYICDSTASSKEEIYGQLKGEVIPPFIWRRDRTMMSFVEFNAYNPLSQFATTVPIAVKTAELQVLNPGMCSNLVNIHLRRIIWNKGIYRDPSRETFYFPVLEKSKKFRFVPDENGDRRWVTRTIFYREDTNYAKKGDVNFYFHRAVELESATYWGTTFIELIPRRYFTLDGATPIEDGDIRARLDANFRDPRFDRSLNRIRLMKRWKFYLFESKNYLIPPESWFDIFRFGEFVSMPVDWSPEVIGRSQTRLWDFKGE